MTGFFGTNHFCHHCKKGYGENHICQVKCIDCQGTECKNIPKLVKRIMCDKCCICFDNEKCFNRHKQPYLGNLSKCDTHYRCTDCSRVFNIKRHPRDDHNCGGYNCDTCKQSVERGHLCYM